MDAFAKDAGKFVSTFGPVHSVAFSHDDNRVVSGSADKTIRIWNVESPETNTRPSPGPYDLGSKNKDATPTLFCFEDSSKLVDGWISWFELGTTLLGSSFDA